ncbi:MAG: tetratricopeptide repeat protein [Verrucomicrobia bacterium]|nr:tetratricopeptide repeat protein [Verrucomicrobiota bacterium]
MKANFFILAFALVGLGTALSQESEVPKTFWSFSLRAAETRLRQGEVGDSAMLLALGHITRLTGLIVDPVSKDCLIVGERDPSLPPLHLEDLVTMLRSVFLYHDAEAPGVTIDPPEKPNELQKVRFFGHVEGTRVGLICFEADYLMKQIGLSLVPGGVPGLRTYWDVALEEARQGGPARTEVLSRFWYFPVVARVVNVGNGVLLDRCELAVLTEVLSAKVNGQPVENLSTFYDQPGATFARSFTDNFDKLARVWPVIADLRSLSALSALGRGLAKMDVRPDLDYWLHEFRVCPVKTPTEVQVLGNTSAEAGFVVEGGVQLDALSLRLKNGDLTAFSDAVLQARPSPEALVWCVWLTPDKSICVPALAQSLHVTSATEAYARGRYLFMGRQYDRAIACWLQVARTYPDMGEIYQWIGEAFERKGLPNCAADYYTKAIRLDPFLANQAQWNRCAGAGSKESPRR